MAAKPAALNVVKDRLEDIGLAPFMLNLHDKAMRPAAVRRQLRSRWMPRRKRIALDSRWLYNEYGRSIAPLRRYPERLHARGKFGESAYSARDKLLASSADYILPVPGSFLTSTDPDVIARVRENFRSLADVGASAGTVSSNPWSLSTLLTSESGSELRDFLERQIPFIRTEFQSLGRMIQHGGSSPRWSHWTNSATSLNLRAISCHRSPLSMQPAAPKPHPPEPN